MNDREKEILSKLKTDFIHYASKCLKIRTKSGAIEPFVLNKAQRYIHEQLEYQRGQTGKVRALILKGRQMGCSSYVCGRFYHKTSNTFGTQTFILTHALDATNNLFKMAKRYYENTPEAVKPSISTNNTKELTFDKLDSGYKVGTAENKSVGRSATIQYFLGSEVAFWSNAAEHTKGILQAVPSEFGTEVILESTANGVGNYFHQEFQKAEAGLSEFIAIFVPWFWQEEYTRTPTMDFSPTPEELELMSQYNLSQEQIAWRRNKIVELSVSGNDGEKSFRQEYPCNASEAFVLTGEDSYIDAAIVNRARHCKDVEKYGALVIGVDPARFGDDRTSIIFRQGRVAFNLKSYVKKDTMEVCGIVHKLIEDHNPVKVFIDVGGLGAGVVDRLNELGYRDIVVPVNGGASPLDAKKYRNKRSEMWGIMLNWLRDEPCQIPDSDSLHADLCNIKYSFDSNSRLLMEKKEDMKRRGIRSCDEADALCLTFSYPISALLKGEDAKSKVLKSMSQDFNKRARIMRQGD